MKQGTYLTTAFKSGLQRGQTKVSFNIVFCLDPVRVAISRLSDSDFDHVSRKELLTIVAFSGLDNRSNVNDSHLLFVGNHELRMLACLARLSCQRAIHSTYIEYGKASPFQGHVALN